MQTAIVLYTRQTGNSTKHTLMYMLPEQFKTV